MLIVGLTPQEILGASEETILNVRRLAQENPPMLDVWDETNTTPQESEAPSGR